MRSIINNHAVVTMLLIKDGKAYCTFCNRLILIDEQTIRTRNIKVTLYCTKCYCKKMGTNVRWRFGDYYVSWHEAQILGYTLGKTGEELLNQGVQFLEKYCSGCNRVIGIYEVEYPEQIMELREQPVFKPRCWVCGCKDGGQRHHAEIIQDMIDHGCGCGGGIVYTNRYQR